MSIRRKLAVCSVALIIPVIRTHEDIRTGTEALNIIGESEGCFLQAYTCPAGLLTDGIGNTTGVISGRVLSVEDVARNWLRDIREAEKCIDRKFMGKNMPEDTYGAMVSAAFNLGCYRLMTYYNTAAGRRVETTIHKKARRMEWEAMCKELPSFNSRGLYPGLNVRREKEMRLCLRGLNKNINKVGSK